MLYKVPFPTGKTLSKTNQTTAEYAKACVTVARECDTQVVDLYSEMMKTPVSFVFVHILMVTSCKDFFDFLTRMNRRVSDAEQEYSLSKAKVKHS